MRVLPFLTVLMFGGPLQAATTCVFTQLNTIGDEIILLNQERGYTFMVIEHDMDFIGCRCDPVICMAKGRVLALVMPRPVGRALFVWSTVLEHPPVPIPIPVSP